MAKPTGYKGSSSKISELKRAQISEMFDEDRVKHKTSSNELMIYKIRIDEKTGRDFYAIKDPSNNTKLKRVPRKYFKFLPIGATTREINLISTDIQDIRFYDKISVTSVGSR